MKVKIDDDGDMRRLAADLEAAAKVAPNEARKVVAKGALNIKSDWKRRWSGHPHAPALPRAVTYDLFPTPGGAMAEIGPDKNKRQGALGNIFEFGTRKNAPIPGGAPALLRETPLFLRAMEDLAEQALERRRQ